MSSRSWRIPRTRGGFTLIEVIGALVIFSVGVLMVVQLSGALTEQMRYAGIRSALAVHASERLDSLDAEPLASLAPGTTVDTLQVEGEEYVRTVVLTEVTAVLMRVHVTIDPASGRGPSLDLTSYVTEAW